MSRYITVWSFLLLFAGSVHPVGAAGPGADLTRPDTALQVIVRQPILGPPRGPVLSPDPLVAISSQYSTTAPSLEYAGSTLWTVFADVDVQGQYAYCNMPEGLGILDVSDPTAPIWVSQLHITGQGGWFLEVHDHLVYYADGHRGFKIVDVTDPTHPVLVGSHDTQDWARDVHVSGNYAFVSDWSNVAIFDISDPTNPTDIVPGIAGIRRAYSCATWGDFLYVAGSTYGVYVVDISDINAPLVSQSFKEPYHTEIVEVAGGRLYTTSGTSPALYFYDLSDPASPALLGGRNIGSIPADLEIIDGILYAAGQSSLRIADIYNPPTFPNQDAYFRFTAGFGVAVQDSFCYVRDIPSALTVLRHYGSDANPVRVGEYRMPGWIEGVSLVGHIALVRDYAWWIPEESNLHVVDISNPREPIALSKYFTPGRIYDAVGQEDIVYVADNVTGLQVVDISDPSNPQLAATYGDIFAYDLAISGDHLYAANTLGLQILDIGDPTSPVLTGSVGGVGAAKSVVVANTRAYMMTDSAGFQVVDVSDPANPTVAGQLAMGAMTVDAVAGEYAYLISNSHLQIVNVSDPTAPSLAGSYYTPLKGWGVAVSGEYAYIADAYLASTEISAIRIVDVSDPMHPVGVGSYQTAGFAWDVVVGQGHVFVADEYGFLSLSMMFGRGDVNADGEVTLADVVYLARYLFARGPAPTPRVDAADFDCNGTVNLVDIVYLANYLLRGGPPPC